ncbi:uncharacterized protein [Pocillopora verrucosa]|uniref:uncharacterized protein n=1 Tax=Pocillopora verrucosa TaxID=203993 RepID=UPI003340BD3B
MKSLLLVLFFGASVTLAKSPFEHKALDEFSDKEREDLLRESADEENDPKLIPPTIFPAEKLCKLSRGICLAVAKDDSCKRLACYEKYKTCMELKLPYPRPTPTPRQKKCLDIGKKCMGKPGIDCTKKLLCMAAVKICLGVNNLPGGPRYLPIAPW